MSIMSIAVLFYYEVMHNTIIRTEQFGIFCRTFNNLVGNRKFFSQ